MGTLAYEDMRTNPMYLGIILPDLAEVVTLPDKDMSCCN